MSWASERLEYLRRSHTWAEIREVTGLTRYMAGEVMSGARALPSGNILNVRSAYSRQVYKDLRAMGVSPSVARLYRWRSVQRAQEFVTSAHSVIDQLATYRLDQYTQYLMRTGAYVSKEVTLERLKESIRRSMARSPIDLGKQAGSDSPSLRHLVVEDEE